jgi:hypothetical protein
MGFDRSVKLKNFFKKNKISFLDKEPMLANACAKELPPLFFCEEFSVFSGSHLVKYISDIHFRYPHSKFFIDISEDFNWFVARESLIHFLPHDSSAIDKFLTFEKASSYDIKNIIKKEDLSDENIVLLDEESDLESSLAFITA